MTYLGTSDMSLTRKRIMKELELLDWSGHVELPACDMEWLAMQLYARLTKPDLEICSACNRPAPLVLPTPVGSICSECIEDMNDNIDQMREAMGESE